MRASKKTDKMKMPDYINAYSARIDIKIDRLQPTADRWVSGNAFEGISLMVEKSWDRAIRTVQSQRRTSRLVEKRIAVLLALGFALEDKLEEYEKIGGSVGLFIADKAPEISRLILTDVPQALQSEAGLSSWPDPANAYHAIHEIRQRLYDQTRRMKSLDKLISDETSRQAAELARSEMVRQEAEVFLNPNLIAAMKQAAPRATAADALSAEVVLGRTELAILQVLDAAGAQTITQNDLAARATGGERSSITTALKSLMGAGLVGHKGARGGYFITTAGRHKLSECPGAKRALSVPTLRARKSTARHIG
jgi:DNA-binding MarR family transcriptional regulator